MKSNIKNLGPYDDEEYEEDYEDNSEELTFRDLEKQFRDEDETDSKEWC